MFRSETASDLAGIRSADRIVAINGDLPIDWDNRWLFHCLHEPLDSTVPFELEDRQELE